jgi:hypothetical protein
MMAFALTQAERGGPFKQQEKTAAQHPAWGSAVFVVVPVGI